MKNLKRIDEAVGSIEERRASAESLLKMVAKGDSKDVEGIKLSKEMADAFLDWLRFSTYGKKFGALPFYKLFTAAFNWGLDRYAKGDAAVKKEFKDLKSKASEMRKAEKFESLKALDEAIELLKSSWKGTKGWNDIARIMDAGLKKAIKLGSVDIRYAKDYIKSLESMAKRNAKKFFDEYGNFTEEDFIEDVEYNMANENKVISEELKGHAKKMKEDGVSDEEIKKMHPEVTDEDLNEAKFSFSEDEVKDVAEVIAKAIAKMDKSKTAVHDMEYDAGRGAGFDISMDGFNYEGGSYTVKDNGDVVNSAIGNSFPNAVYAKIGDTDIRKVMKNIKKFESVTEAEDFKPHMMYDPETGKEYKAEKPEDHERMAKLGYVHEKPEIKENNMKNFKSYGSFINEEYDTEARKKMAEKGFALADGSFPIANLEDLKNAIQAYGRAKDQAKAAKFIVKRAKALGAEDLVPDTDDFQKSLDEVYTQVPAKTIAVTEGTDIGSWNQGGLKGKENVLITTFVGPKDVEDFGLGRKCMQINVGMKYVSLNPADIVELKDILKSYKVK